MKKALFALMFAAIFALAMPVSAKAAEAYPLDRAGEFVATNPVAKTVCVTPFTVVGDFFSALLARDQNY